MCLGTGAAELSRGTEGRPAIVLPDETFRPSLMLRCNGIRVRSAKRCIPAMIDTLAPHRPGLAAIAAVLALSSTPVLAQLALPAVPAGPVASAPVSTPQAVPPAATALTAPMQAPVQTVQNLPPAAPRLPEMVATQSRTISTANRQPRAERTVERKVASARQAGAAVEPAAGTVPIKVAPAAAAPISPIAQASRSGTGDLTPIASAPVRATTVRPATSGGMDYASWVLLGGGLLLVVGGATFAMTRRPRRRDEAYRASQTGTGSDVVSRAPASLSPLAPTAAIAQSSRPVAVVETPVAHTPAMAAQSMARKSYADAAAGDNRTALEAMIAQTPSEANPFHSRRNRLRRANFLLRTGQAAPNGEFAPARREQVASASDRWTEMSFGGQRAARLSWKPITNR
ncbi:hypothetical protein BH10PSE13_BH10PSE13_14670 [soil metagenome]